MTVRIYRWDDASAPTLNWSSGSFTDLLRACLVDGYGAKAGSGWTLAYSGTDVYGFTNNTANGGTGMGIKVDHSADSVYPKIVGFESINTSTGVVTDPFPTTAQFANGLYVCISSTGDVTNRPWIVVADSRRFYLWVGYNLTTAQNLSASSTMQMMYFAGDIASNKPTDGYAFMVIANGSASASSNPFAEMEIAVTTSSTSHMLARAHGGATKSLYAGKSVVSPNPQAGVIGVTGAFTYPDPFSGGMLLGECLIGEGGSATVLRGKLPGLYAPLHNLPGNNGDTFTGTGTLAGKTFMLLDACSSGSRGRVALEISDTW